MPKFNIVAFWNLDRPMFMWTEICTVIRSRVSCEGCSIGALIAVTVVDVIHQVAREFLAKPKSAQCHVYRHFLHPFLEIYEHSLLEEIHTLVLACAASLAVQFADNLRSTRDVLFRILSTAAILEGPR
jgi:hypothetical protein